jgi:exodeoxyribonuclease V gamma subunit
LSSVTERETGLTVHRAERADALADGLAELIAVPPADPFGTEVVAVPARGVERWLAQRLSHRLGAGPGAEDGVCAGVTFPAPAALLGAAVATATGVDPDTDPWEPSRLAWPLLEVIDSHAGEPWCAALGAHVDAGERGGARRGRRYGTARRLAELFATYAVHRPGLLHGWADGAGLEGDLNWQPELWRRLRARIGGPDPAERWAAGCVTLRADPEACALPQRLSLFGPTRLPAAHLDVLVVLARHRAVHLWLAHPSPALWDRVAARLPGGRADGPPRRAADPTATAGRHLLLSSLGRDVRELQVRLAAAAPDATNRHHPAADPPPTLLGRLQRALRADLPPAAPRPLSPGDRSVAVHACHGPHRQVEVLRELVVGLLADDPTLQPRDIVVMCPDVETFAPLVSAAFGSGPSGSGPTQQRPGQHHPGQHHPGQGLPVRLADRALRQVNPVLATVGTLLELADSRVTAAQALDLLASPPVRLRFRLDETDLERLRLLATRAGVRWGLDAEHRGRFRLAGYRQGTWAAGLDRLLLGVAMSGAGEPGWLGTALPLAEIDSADTVAIGRLAEYLERLTAVLRSLTGEQPLGSWLDALDTALELLTDTGPADSWQLVGARAELAAAGRAAGPHADTVPLGLADVRDLLAERLRGRPTRAGFRTGTITVATLVPMRSVPHRVVCLLGLDDGVFPRAAAPDGDDLLARDPLVGERDARSEDRQLLLDAIGAATEHLLVVYSGADERTGARRPPAVPLGELLDAIEVEAGPAGREQVIVRHPLQPFHPRNFLPGVVVPQHVVTALPGRPFSFDRTELAGALAGAGPKAAPTPFLPVPLAPTEPTGGTVRLDELTTFLEHPVKGFLRQRVGLPGSAADRTSTDALPVQLDGLATWAVGDRLLADRLAGHPLERCRQAEWRRGELPPGALGVALLTAVLDDVEPLVAVAAPDRADPLPDRDLDVALPGGEQLVGTLDGLYRGADGPTLLRVVYSRLAPKQRVRAWVQLLALTAATGQPWRAVTVGRGTYHGVARSTLGPLDPQRALALLGELVAVRATGLTEPLPLPTVAGHEYARAWCGGADPAAAAEEAMKRWTGRGAPAERLDEAHQRVWGPAAAPEVLLAQPGPAGGQPTRFGALAVALWEPLLLAEDVQRL